MYNINLFNCSGPVMTKPIYHCLFLCTPNFHLEAAIGVAFWVMLSVG